MAIPKEPWGKLNPSNPHDYVVSKLASCYHYVVKAPRRPWRTAGPGEFDAESWGVADVSSLTDPAEILHALRRRSDLALGMLRWHEHRYGEAAWIYWQRLAESSGGFELFERQRTFLAMVQDTYIRHTFGASMVAAVNAVRADTE